MLLVTNPKTGKTYTYADRNSARAQALATKLGVTVQYHDHEADGHDRRKDAMAERGTLRASRYVR